MCFGHYNPKQYYENLFTLTSQHGYSILDIERMYPFELTVLIEWINRQELEKEREQQKVKSLFNIK